MKLLQHWGHRVDLASDGTLALRAAKATRPEVVLLDIDLPGMSGHEVARRLRAEVDLEDTLLVALTGWGGEGEKERSRQAGCDLHWVKPVDPNALRDLLARVSPPRGRVLAGS
jgi:CheY-like chemotaxis protein